MPDSIHIHAILVKHLYDFACDFFAHPEGQVTAPITKLRALAQSKNPDAGPDDIGLFVAYNGKQCVGYRGILPGALRRGAQTSKVHWASSLFVLPEYRQQKLGQRLVQHWMKIGDVAATGSTDAAMGVYQRCAFCEVGPLRYVALKLEGLNRVAAPFRALHRHSKQNSFFHHAAQRGLAATTNLFYPFARDSFYREVSARGDQALQDMRFVEVPRIRPLAGAAAPDHAARPHFHRGLDTINWMLEHHWFSEHALPATPPCYFSDARELFQYHAFEVRCDDAQPAGFVVLLAWRAQHRAVVKLLDHQLADATARATAFWLAMRQAARYQVDRIELPIEFESFARQLPAAAHIVSITDRRYFLHPLAADSPLAQAKDSLALNFCDSDLAFY